MVSKRRKVRGGAGKVQKASTGAKAAGKPARLTGIFKRLLKGFPREAGSVEWQPEPPMADSPNQAFVQNSAETALLDTLRGRAQLLDQVASPLPVAKLLYSLVVLLNVLNY